ncbi:uncharacterized protein [Rutidosis leptorrhynchoides]|uniref:uncharacterized protein n=1 Tax=Rutidosis leptorrhynchoides TaxID=125765 RepID=UPI003A98FE96
MALLNAYTKHDKTKDSWIWNLTGNGVFTTKKLASIIDEVILNIGSRPKEGFLKNNLVPSKVSIFIWRALKRRLPVRTELDKRGIDLDSALVVALSATSRFVPFVSFVVCYWLTS